MERKEEKTWRATRKNGDSMQTGNAKRQSGGRSCKLFPDFKFTATLTVYIRNTCIRADGYSCSRPANASPHKCAVHVCAYIFRFPGRQFFEVADSHRLDADKNRNGHSCWLHVRKASAQCFTKCSGRLEVCRHLRFKGKG